MPMAARFPCGAILAMLGRLSPSRPLPEEKTEHVHVFVEGMDPIVEEPAPLGGHPVAATTR